ncbi:MAG: heme ABC exporter ATP-binding protein CcmA [Euryarchaeota archaeon]|nr:heme ABC exporter ATP-binding protein CcmA [Euryarchaeota archaeon]
MHAVELRDVEKSFGRHRVLRGVTLSVERGEAFVLLGPNGAGKTTLIRIVATLLRQDSGEVRVLGYDARKEAQEVRRRIGVVSHNPLLYEELTARENLEFYARAFGVPIRRAEEMLERVELEERADDQVSTFSRGMKQRLSIARALLHSPQVLLLDEPTTGLDIRGRRDFYALLERLLEEGVTLLMTTHHPEEAERLCSRGAVLHSGRVVAEGRIQELKASVGSLEEAYLRATGEEGET